jgi:hypothetical protein
MSRQWNHKTYRERERRNQNVEMDIVRLVVKMGDGKEWFRVLSSGGF